LKTFFFQFKIEQILPKNTTFQFSNDSNGLKIKFFSLKINKKTKKKHAIHSSIRDLCYFYFKKANSTNPSFFY
jgi:hypothetical protein